MENSQKSVKEKLRKLRGWKLKGQSIWKIFYFRDFTASMKFVDSVAILAERLDHHPDILIKYDTVQLNLTTHDEGGLTEKDFALAAQINKIRK